MSETDPFFFSLGPAAYCRPPFHPDRDYPEFNAYFDRFDPSNQVYRRVRELFLMAGLDEAHAGSPRWNPFRGLVAAGGHVVIKPNLVLEATDGAGEACGVTHANVLRPIIDYLQLLRVLDGIEFTVTIADVPLQSANFDALTRQNGLAELVSDVRSRPGPPVVLLDLRRERAVSDGAGFIIRREAQAGDPLGYTAVHLEASYLDEIVGHADRFSVGDYDARQAVRHHRARGAHYYEIANTVLRSTLFINVPKIKTHQKAGVTAALKNLIGINGDKSWVPHFRAGAARFGGDEFSNEHLLLKYVNSLARRHLQGRSQALWRLGRTVNRVLVKRFAFGETSGSRPPAAGGPRTASSGYRRRMAMDGAWYGNDTLWRPILDLNRLLCCCDASGAVRPAVQRQTLCLGDGIVAAEGEGPLLPTPKPAGLLTLSRNPVVHDVCCATLMGFDWERTPQLRRAVALSALFGFDGDTSALRIRGAVDGSGPGWMSFDRLPALGFVPPAGWAGHIERRVER